jgi:hypothetical protein
MGYGRWARAAALGVLLLATAGHDRKPDPTTLLPDNPPDVVVLDPVQRAKAALSSMVELHWEVVNLKTGTRQPAKGSGFWIQDARGEWLIATAGHNLQTIGWDAAKDGEEVRENITVLVWPRDKQPKEPIRAFPLKPAQAQKGKEAISTSPDFAILRLAEPGFVPPKGTKAMVFRDLKAEPLVAGEFVAILGSPEHESFKVYTGVVKDPNFLDLKYDPLPLVSATAYSRPGSSGGPAIDSKGRVVGILAKGIHGGSEDTSLLVPNTQSLPLMKAWLAPPNP